MRGPRPDPVFREVRVFAVDPGTAAPGDGPVVRNQRVLRVPWERLDEGPAGAYVRVVAGDTGAPVDLDRPDVLAARGLPPCDGDPAFRAQMLYAVAMATITTLERALGRPVQWPPLAGGGHRARLDLVAHAGEMANAHFDPEHGLRFGYFRADAGPAAGTVVFTCLSQDVVAHELTHALLSGMDLAFDAVADLTIHELLADLVAVLAHFDDTPLLHEQLRTVRGDLERHPTLGAVALQMGRALGLPDGVRNLLGSTRDGRFTPCVPDPATLRTIDEPHQRAEVLGRAVFAAFRTLHTTRTAGLLRLATRGSGVLPAGELHPDVVRRLTRALGATAREIQLMCLRAVDYLPPVGVTDSDFLRAVVTADQDLDPDDPSRRIAFLEAFRAYGIVPPEVLTTSVTTMVWPTVPEADAGRPEALTEYVRELAVTSSYWTLPTDRAALWALREQWRATLAQRLAARPEKIGPVDLARPFAVRAFDLRRRPGTRGDLDLEWVVRLVQQDADRPTGVTLLVDVDDGRVRRVIGRPQPDPTGDLLARASGATAPRPARRRLRVYAFDPALGDELATAAINEATIAVPEERDALGPGPTGEYVEVIDHDPASGCFYPPVDLDEPAVAAQHGLAPSESDPQFHQQMVYAVCMRIIGDFEAALGRRVLWSPRFPSTHRETYVQRLRIHPHALREANAYYSPERKALLFGYFPAPVGGPDGPALTVFSCLSHDIIAHEVTHAVLDGIHQRFVEPTNPDVLAFHEAFADLVALFEHFSLPEALEHTIVETRGDLGVASRLGELAQQFGRATGRSGALRSAIGAPADPARYATAHEPHDRGAILVAAVFDAFVTIYTARVADLLRIATGGTGVLPEGRIAPELAAHLAVEAAAAAQRVLGMCIRALDYCPPVDLTFGDYLRALVTADVEHDPVDDAHERVAFVAAFRRHGLVPEDVRAFSVDGLLWRPLPGGPDGLEDLVAGAVRGWAAGLPSWHLSRDRRELFEATRQRRSALHGRIRTVLDKGGPDRWDTAGLDPEVPFEVHSLRPSTGSDWHGRPTLRWIIELLQQVAATGDDRLHGGVTLVVDGTTGQVRYAIRKPLDDRRRARQRAFLDERRDAGLAAVYGADATQERFAALHRG